MKHITFFLIFSYAFILGQNTGASAAIINKQPSLRIDETSSIPNDSIAVLIPFNKLGKFGYIDQTRKIIIPAIYTNVGFFTEDCNLLNSPQKEVIKFGAAHYASVRLKGIDYRIDRLGKRVYTYSAGDLGKCTSVFRPQLFQAYIVNNKYGLIEAGKYSGSAGKWSFKINPQYDYVHIMEGDDLHNPMIIAVKNNKFGVVDINNTVIIPFEYDDIKRNYSWKLARLFEVTKNGKAYYHVDRSNRAY